MSSASSIHNDKNNHFSPPSGGAEPYSDGNESSEGGEQTNARRPSEGGQKVLYRKSKVL